MTVPSRILYICHDGDLYGSQQSLSLIVQHLSTQAFQPFVSIARKGPLNDRLAALPGVTVLAHKRLQWIKHDPRSPLKQLGDILTLLVAAPFRVWGLARQIRRHHIALVHTNSSVSLEGALAARLCGIPHVWHIRELFMEENPKLQMVLGRKLSRGLMMGLSERILCISEAVARQFEPYRARNPEKFPVIYNAMMLPEAVPKDMAGAASLPEKTGFRIGYIGRLSAGKRFGDLLEALALLKRDGLVPQVLVAGNFVDAPYEREIHEKLHSLDLTKQVHLLGYLSDTAPLLASLDLLVLTSLNEPFGRVLIEAMAADVPCVAADSGGVPEIVTHGDTGWLYPPGDVAALAAQVACLMRDAELLREVREKAGRQARKRFTIETQIRMLEACYQSIFQKRP